jgi:hypothetical protein
VSIEYLQLVDYLAIAVEVTGLSVETITRVANLDLADSALHAPAAGSGDTEFYPDFTDKAAVLTVRLPKNHPLPDGNKASRVGGTAALRRAQWTGMDESGDRGCRARRAGDRGRRLGRQADRRLAASIPQGTIICVRVIKVFVLRTLFDRSAELLRPCSWRISGLPALTRLRPAFVISRVSRRSMGRLRSGAPFCWFNVARERVLPQRQRPDQRSRDPVTTSSSERGAATVC